MTACEVQIYPMPDLPQAQSVLFVGHEGCEMPPLFVLSSELSAHTVDNV